MLWVYGFIFMDVRLAEVDDELKVFGVEFVLDDAEAVFDDC